MNARWAVATGAGALFALAPTGAVAAGGDPSEERSESRRYIAVLKGSVDRPGEVATEHEDEYDAAAAADVYRSALSGCSAAIPASQLSAVGTDSDVRAVVPDRRLQPARAPPNTDIPAIAEPPISEAGL